MAIPKILGTETEYGIIGRHDPDFDPISRTLLLINSYQSDMPLSSLWDYTQESARFDPQAMSLDEIYDIPDQPDPLSINKVLANGARYYLDHAHPEYSTPECANVRDLVCYEKAGDRILEQSQDTAAQVCSWMGGSSCFTKIIAIIKAIVTGTTKITCLIGIPPFD